MIHSLCAKNPANKTMTDKEQRTRIKLKIKTQFSHLRVG